MVVGIVKEMVMGSPYQPIQPCIFSLDYGWLNVITVRLNPTMPAQTALNALEPVFKRYDPGSTFQYTFVDEQYAKKFSDEKRIGSLASVFAVLAVFISCLGLFGLAELRQSFVPRLELRRGFVPCPFSSVPFALLGNVAEQRIREIGVRKVLGASLFNPWKLLSVDFVMLVIVSCVIAVPIAYYFLYNWLQQYEYRTPMSWWVFAAASVGALVITLLTVSYQAGCPRRVDESREESQIRVAAGFTGAGGIPVGAVRNPLSLTAMHPDEFWQLLRKQFSETDLPQWTATIFGVAEVLLARVNNILLYPAGIISSVISVYLLLEVKLYADATLNSYYVLMSIYGWWYWTRKSNEPPVTISWTTRREWWTVAGIVVIGFGLCYFLLRAYTNSTVPAWDAWVSVVAWAGTWLLARRKIENWVVLNVSNLFAIPLLIYKGLPLFAVLTIILFVVAVAGFFDWRRRYKLQTL